MLYSIRHRTHFKYSAPIRESQMELRMQPRSECAQRCEWFDVQVSPRPRLGVYKDCWDNFVHFFDVPGLHEELQIATHAVVEVEDKHTFGAPKVLPSWEALDEQVGQNDFWDFLLPSRFARSSELLGALAKDWNATRRDDPFSLLHEISTRISNNFEYAPLSTRADSPIDEALDARRGVCQDFTHIFIAIARELGIPCRYVSGYLHHAQSDRSLSNATHAWAEAWLPESGWIGFDPTNNQIAGERHLRTAIGRDYADVPPTRGVYKGRAITTLSVEVEVKRISQLPPEVLAPSPNSLAFPTGNSNASTPTQGISALSAVWPPPSMQYVDDVSEQAQQQQQIRPF